jgi:hypothetical protein
MNFSQATRGEPLRIGADQWNAHQETAVRVREGGKTSNRPKAIARPNGTLVLVQNTSGAPIDRFHALAISEPCVTPVQRESEFLSGLILKGVKPTSATKGRWCVVQESIRADGFGLAIASGATICRVTLPTKGDTSVETTNGTTIPVGGNTGLATILWVAGGVGTATATGEQWAIIRLGGSAGSVPIGEYVGMSLQVTAQNAIGYLFEEFHPLIL